jgi:hypothetical protein
VIVWRFTGTRLHSEHAELRAQRLVAIQFFILASYITVQAIRDLAGGEHPDASWVGIGLAISSIVLMPALGIAKQRIGEGMGSVATQGDGAEPALRLHGRLAARRPRRQRAARTGFGIDSAIEGFASLHRRMLRPSGPGQAAVSRRVGPRGRGVAVAAGRGDAAALETAPRWHKNARLIGPSNQPICRVSP